MYLESTKHYLSSIMKSLIPKFVLFFTKKWRDGKNNKFVIILMKKCTFYLANYLISYFYIYDSIRSEKKVCCPQYMYIYLLKNKTKWLSVFTLIITNI